MKYLLAVLMVVLVGCGSSTQPTAIPSSTAVPLSQINLEPLLVQSGDLPAGLSGSQVRDEAPEMFRDMPKYENVIYQRFENKGQVVGGITVFLYASGNDINSAYSSIEKGIGSGTEPLSDIGEKGIVAELSLLDNTSTDILFVRCQAVVHIRMPGDKTDSTPYARRLDKRITPVVCQSSL